MSDNNKMDKFDQNKNQENNMDMFSKLPDSLLFIIISHLPFEEAARTSSLSSRWRHSWHATKKIEFIESFFVDLDDYTADTPLQKRAFIDFARQWIENYQEPIIDIFRLAFSISEENARFERDIEYLIEFSLARNVKELILDFRNPWSEHDLDNLEEQFGLPKQVYEQEGLESVELFACGLELYKFKSFNTLKKISLGWIQLPSCIFENFLRYCPLLESLSLKRCWEEPSPCGLWIQNSGLRTLVIYKCDYCPHGIVIQNLRNLKSLKYCGRMSDITIRKPWGRELIDPEEAEFDFPPEFQSYQDTEEVGDLLYELVKQLYPVKVLTICSSMLQFISTKVKLDTSLNVKHLILNASLRACEFPGIKFMLLSCPLLETLSINVHPETDFSDYESPESDDKSDTEQQYWSNINIEAFKCISTSLKIVEVKGFTGHIMELEFLQFLLRFGSIIERLNLYLAEEGEAHIDDSNSDDATQFLHRAQAVQQFEKASTNLIISIFN